MKKYFVIPIAVFLLLHVATIAADPTPSKEKPAQKESDTEKEKTDKISWLKYDEGLELAKEEGKKVFVEFTAKWCGWCKKMHSTTFVDPEVVGLMSDNYVAVSVDGDSQDTLNIDGWITSERALARQYQVRSYPTYWFLTSEAEPIAPVKGYRSSKDLGNILDYLKDDLYKTTSFKEYLEARDKK